MSYKNDRLKLKLKRKDDSRVKLTEQNKNDIIDLYKQGYGIRAIAREFEDICSRRMIQFIIFPERMEKVKAQFKERRKDGRYYDREKHTIAIRKLRNKRQQLYLKNELI